MADTKPHWLTKSQAAALKGCSEKTIDTRRADGLLTAYRINGRIYFKREDLDAAFAPVPADD